MNEPHRHCRRLLLAVTWLTDFAAFLLVFVVSRSLAERDAGVWELGLIGGVFSLAVGASGLISGHLSDGIGRRRVVLGGTVLLIFSITACTISQWSGEVSLTAYACAGVALGMVYPPIYAWLTSIAPNGKRSRGVGRNVILFALMWNGGMISGQLTGGWLFTWSPLWPLGAAIGLASVNVGMLLLAGPSRSPTAAHDEPPRTAGDEAHQTLSASFARLAWLANLGGAFATAMIIHLMPKLCVELGIPPDRHGLLLSLNRVGVIVTYFAMYLLSFWRMRVAPAMVSQLIAAAGMMLIAQAQSQAMLALGLLAMAQLGGFNYFASLYYSTHGSTHARRGIASGIHEATLSLGFAAGCFLGGWAGHVGQIGTPYRLAAAVIILMAVTQCGAYILQLRTRRRAVSPI